jgi:hypothetical protein
MMSEEIEIVKVTMPNGDIRETDMPTIQFVHDMNTKYSGGTVLAPWNDIMKMNAAQEYLKQNGGVL